MRVLITNGYIVYYSNVVAFKTEIYDDDDVDDDDDAIHGHKIANNANVQSVESVCS